jgi:hypothetical protein
MNGLGTWERKGFAEYCYRLQCWLQDGRVAKCGHETRVGSCYACDNAGERHSCPNDH